jgi:hypothetical protein
VRESGDLRLIFPARRAAFGAVPVSGTLSTASPPSVETQHLACSTTPATDDYYRHAFPEVVDVMIRVLTDEGARLVAAFEAGRLQPPAGVDPGDHWWTLAEAHSQVFTERIAVAGRPL